MFSCEICEIFKNTIFYRISANECFSKGTCRTLSKIYDEAFYNFYLLTILTKKLFSKMDVE